VALAIASTDGVKGLSPRDTRISGGISLDPPIRSDGTIVLEFGRIRLLVVAGGGVRGGVRTRWFSGRGRIGCQRQEVVCGAPAAAGRLSGGGL
jgi:hypothetical protein